MGFSQQNNENIQWRVSQKRECSDGGYYPLHASKRLPRFRTYGISDKRFNVGTHLQVSETINRDYSYSLTIYFEDTPMDMRCITLPIEDVKPGDIESACNAADDIYRSLCTKMVEYFTEDCKMLPDM